MEIFTIFIENYKEVFEAIVMVLGSVIALATIIVGITPTQADDAVRDTIISFLDRFSILNKKIK